MGWFVSDIPLILYWWLAVVLLGWLVWPLLFRSMVLLPDKALGLSKLFGLMLFGFICAWGGFLFPFDEPGDQGQLVLPVMAILVLLALNAPVALKTWPAMWQFMRERWRMILAYELLFLLVYLAYLYMRSWFPDATFDVERAGAEKWGNLSVLTSLWRHPLVPPPDPWLAGKSLNYYYFSHLIWARLGRLVFAAPEMVFNLGLATLFGLLLQVCLSTGLAFFERWSAAIWAVVLIAFTGPLIAWDQLGVIINMVDVFNVQAGFSVFNFWTPSDVIPNTRNEFPAFNWLLGDLHAHATGFLLLLAALSLVVQFRRLRESEIDGWFFLLLRQWPTTFLMAVTIGCMWATNAWDLVVLGIFCGFWFLAEARESIDWHGALAQLVQAALCWIILAAVGVLFLARFYTSAAYMPLDTIHNPLLARLPSVLGVLGAVGSVAAEESTGVAEWLAFWGLFAVPMVAIWIWNMWSHGKAGWNSKAFALVLLGLILLVQLHLAGRPFAIVGLALIGVAAWIAVSLFRALSASHIGPRELWSRLLLLAALVCQIIPEFFYIDDPIGPPYERYNTLFKLYYPTWGLMALALAGMLSRLQESLAPQQKKNDARDFQNLQLPEESGEYETDFPTEPAKRRRQFAGYLLLGGLAGWLIIGGGFYTLMGTGSRMVRGAEWIAQNRPDLEDWTSNRQNDLIEYGRSLNAIDFMGLPRYAPDDLQLALWMRENLPDARGLVETSGDSYSMIGRFAAISGIPCLLGWENHESQWRGQAFTEEYKNRRYAIEQIYRSTDPGIVQAMCQIYGMRYVVVGKLEREEYPAEGLDKFDKFAIRRANFGESFLYEIPFDAAP
ncbi:MAG: DUF2298 domain-containing protein [Candidatus Sumerlaeia bacterium]